MKKIFLLAALACSVMFADAQNLIVGSYNIRNDNKGDAQKGDGWATRYQILCDQVQWYGFDIFGTQEVKKNQLDDMLREMPEYAYEGVARDDGKEKGEYSPIFYKKDRFKYLEGGTFWISPTPEKVGVKGWDAALPRICSYVRLQDKVTKVKFWFFNLHMDHIGVEARREGAKLIIKQVLEMCGKEPAIVTGDFNVDQNNEAYHTMLQGGVMKDSYEAAAEKFATNGTFNSFNADLHTKSRIDHIFVTSALEVTNYAVLTDGYWIPNTQPEPEIKGNAAPQEISFRKHIHRCPSDHYPIAARIVLKK